MKTFQKTIIINATPQSVFEFMDDVRNSGMHMSKDSKAMMGTHLELQLLSKNFSGPETSYRYIGKVMGMTIDFTVVVTRWIQNMEKIWETIGHPKVIVIGWFRMFLKLTPKNGNTSVELGISYEKPKSFFGKILCFFFGSWYAKWCLKNMLNDAKKNLEMKN